MSVAAAVPEAFRSPLAGVGDLPWTSFVAAMAEPEFAHAANETGHLGLFLFSVARLCHLGYCANVQYSAGPVGRVGTADFAGGLTEEEFLARPVAQYQIFVQSCSAYWPSLPADPAPIAGVAVTPSGLLAVAHRAGLRGLKGWLKSPADRESHPFTTDAFSRANGLF